jgi:hypothetical protein
MLNLSIYLGAFADQGLLYHWVKYHKKSYTHVFPTHLEDWGPDENGSLTMLNIRENRLPSCLPSIYNNMIKKGKAWWLVGSAPYRDFVHFTSTSKPWLASIGRPLLEEEDLSMEPASKSAVHWVQIFGKVMKKLNMTLTFQDILQNGSAPLGITPTLRQSVEHRTFFDDTGKRQSKVPMPVQPALPQASVLKSNGKFAYAFLITGYIDNAMYRGYIYNILVSAHILQESASTADIFVMVRTHPKSNLSSLPTQTVSLLSKIGVQIRDLPVESSSDLYPAMLAKFFILDYSEYDRVMFLNADVMPLCNLDYVFHLSMAGKIRENVVLTWNHEPASGGFFMLKPGGKDELDEIVRKHRRFLESRPGKGFDPIVGWGHTIQPPDAWRALAGTKETLWKMHGEYLMGVDVVSTKFVPILGIPCY